MSYVAGKMTILANTTFGVLNTSLPSGKGKRSGLVLPMGACIDVENIMTKEQIRAYLSDFEAMEANGYIKWFSKGSNPTAAQIVPRPTFVPNPVGSTVAPPNEFDAKLNALLAEEKKRDERTLPSDTGRITEESYGAAAGIDAAAERAKIQREAELEAKERALIEKERELKEREEKLSGKGKRGPRTLKENVGA